MRFAMPPEAANSIVPDANEEAIPSAWFNFTASKFNRRPAAAAEPNTPDIDVG
jgi:hypothetical protein